MSLILPAAILALLLAAAGCLVGGVFVNFGLGWALIAAAPCLAGLSVLAALALKPATPPPVQTVE